MAYNKFHYKTVGEKLGITFGYDSSYFQDIRPVTPRPMILDLLQPNDHYLLTSEIARREWYVSTVFRELIYQTDGKVCIYSGERFDVETSLGLSGEADYLIGLGKVQIPIQAPIIAVAEAKPDYLLSGLGQCIAEMVAARLYNERNQTPTRYIYGVVTTGLLWGFLVLDQNKVYMDSVEYNLNRLDQILGILIYMSTHAISTDN